MRPGRGPRHRAADEQRGRATLLAALDDDVSPLLERATVGLAATVEPTELCPGRRDVEPLVRDLLSGLDGTHDGRFEPWTRRAADCAARGIPGPALMRAVGAVSSVLVDDVADRAAGLEAVSPATAARVATDVAALASMARLAVRATTGDPVELALDWNPSDPGPPYALVVGVPLSAAADPASTLSTALGRRLRVVAEAEPPDPAHAVVVVPTTSPPQLADLADLGLAATETGALLLVHPPAFRPQDLARHYRRTAPRLLELVRALGPRPRAVRPEYMAALVALHTAPLRARVAYVRAILGPVLAQPWRTVRPLLELLASLADEVPLGAQAHVLGLHHKTVPYRRGRLAELTGLDVLYPPHRLRLLLAYVLWRGSQPAMPAICTRAWRGGRPVSGSAG